MRAALQLFLTLSLLLATSLGQVTSDVSTTAGEVPLPTEELTREPKIVVFVVLISDEEDVSNDVSYVQLMLALKVAESQLRRRHPALLGRRFSGISYETVRLPRCKFQDAFDVAGTELSESLKSIDPRSPVVFVGPLRTCPHAVSVYELLIIKMPGALMLSSGAPPVFITDMTIGTSVRMEVSMVSAAFMLRRLIDGIALEDRVTVLYEAGHQLTVGSCRYLTESLFSLYGTNLTAYDVTNWTSSAQVRRQLHRHRKDKDLFVVCASPSKVRQLVTSASAIEMNDCDEYRWVVADLFDDSPQYKKGVWRHDSSWSGKDKMAYSNLVVFALKETPESHMRRKLANIYRQLDLPEPSPEVQSNIVKMQDALLVYIEALSVAYKRNIELTNASLVYEFMKNRTIRGFYRNIIIDDWGERQENYDILVLKDIKHGQFSTIGDGEPGNYSTMCSAKKMEVKKRKELYRRKRKEVEQIQRQSGLHDFQFTDLLKKKLAELKAEEESKKNFFEYDGNVVAIASVSAILTCLVFILFPLCLRHRRMMQVRRNLGENVVDIDAKKKAKKKKKSKHQQRPEEVSTSSTRMSYLDEEISSSSSSSSSSTSSSTSTTNNSYKQIMNW